MPMTTMPSLHRCAFAATAALSLLPLLPAQGDFLYTVSSQDGFLRTVNLATLSTTASVQITSSSGGLATQCNGLTLDPLSRQVVALVRFGMGPRNLCTLDPATGVATIIGAMSDQFAGIAFRIDGQLYGVTGDGANTPESLYTISTTNAQATLVRSLGSGSDGETICFAPDLSLYHASGLGVPNVDEAFERFDTFTNTLTNVPLSGYDFDELLSLTSYTGDNLIGVDLYDDVVAITTSGHVTYLGLLDHSYVKGILFAPTPGTQPFFRPYGDGCATAAGSIPILFGTGTPTGGQTVGLHLRSAPSGSFGLLAGGFGNGVVPLPSAACPVQIVPVLFTFGFSAGTAGEFNHSLTLPATIQPLDAYFQVGALDGTGFVVSNPLLMHAL
jgi:hypothetical protein